MNLNGRMSWLSAAGLGGLLLAGPAVPPARAQISVRFGTSESRLEGQRFTTMRGLAHHLDEAAQRAARVAGDTQQERNGRMQQRFLWAINDFARQTRSFHERLDQYASSPWDVADEVAALDQRARQVNTQIHGANAFPAYQPFDEHSQYRDGRHVESTHDSGDRNSYVTGTALREFRRLANSLDAELEREVSVAEQGLSQPYRSNRSLADLRAFAQRASNLNESSRADALNPREVGPVVGRLMDDARQNDRSRRENNEFASIEWAPSIRLLEQMASIVQSQ